MQVLSYILAVDRDRDFFNAFWTCWNFVHFIDLWNLVSLCVTCYLFLEGRSVLSKTTGKNCVFTSSVSCTDKNIIYLVTCLNDSCGKQYVGKSIQEMRKRHYGHRREIEIKSSPLGKHFSDVCGYDRSDKSGFSVILYFV